MKIGQEVIISERYSDKSTRSNQKRYGRLIKNTPRFYVFAILSVNGKVLYNESFHKMSEYIGEVTFD